MRKLIFFVMLMGLFFIGKIALAQDSTNNQIVRDSGQAQTSMEAPKPDTAMADTIYPVTPERRALLNKYSNFSLGWSVFNDIFSWILLAIIAFSGASTGLLNLAGRISNKKSAQFLLYLLFISLITTLITLPLDIYRDYFVEHQYSLSSQSFASWLWDWVKAFPIGYIVSVIAFGFLYFLIRKYARRWWLYFSIGAIPFVVLLIVIVPVVISPMFNKFEPLKDQVLKTDILNLASKAGIDGAKVFQVDASKQSNKLNAYVTGLFSTKRIVLYDTIIKAMTPNQLLFVMAHEMGHYVMHHVWYEVIMIILLLLFSTWIVARFLPAIIMKYQNRLRFDDLKSYASLPLIMLAISMITFFTQPITNGVSRHFEHQADKYGIEMTEGNAVDAKIAFEKLSAYNLSDPNPSSLVEFWFYNHPALQKRIDFVEGYKTH